jgi:hypothetical protein
MHELSPTFAMLSETPDGRNTGSRTASLTALALQRTAGLDDECYDNSVLFEHHLQCRGLNASDFRPTV